MSQLKRQLTLREGIPLAIGSIIGSGILFLPSLTFKASQSDVLLAWLLAIVICLPGLIFFSDMVEAVPNESGMSGFVSLGLGKHVGATIPIILLSTVCIGMPASALIAAQYLQNYWPEHTFIKPLVSFALVGIAIFSNIFGMKVSGRILKIVSFLLFAVGAALVALTTKSAYVHYAVLTPQYDWHKIVSGAVLAFWAFAGFENLTFMAGEFKNPKRDLFISILIAITTCGALYFLLTANYAALVPQGEIDSLAGLYQLSALVPPKAITTFVIALFALAAVQINLNSWTAGVSRAVFSSAKGGLLPSYFSKLDANSIPKRAILLLGGLFTLSLLISNLVPNIFEALLRVVSTNFIFIYVLAIASFVLFSKSKSKKIAAGIFLVGMIGILASSRALVLYPVAVFAAAYFMGRRREVALA